MEQLSTQQLRCEFLTAPRGVDTRAPRLTWILTGSATQAAWQLQVASTQEQLASGHPDLWDSGRTDGNGSAATYAGTPLTSRQACHWRVKIWDTAGHESAWSTPASFEMGLLDSTDWQARWIGRPEHDAGLPTCYSPLLRKSFHLSAKPIRARLYSTGLAWVEVVYNSIRGEIRSAWRRDGETLVIELTIPGNTTAEIQLPAATHANITFATPEQTKRATPAGTRNHRATFELPPGVYRAEMRTR